MTLPDIFADGPMTASLNAGDNTYASGANGISILEDVLTTPNGITMNSVGISYDNGTTITSTSWDDISTRVAQLSAIAPNGLNASLLAVNDTISIQNADTAPTRVINTQAGDTTGGTHFGVAWVGNTLPFVMETLDATPLEVKDTTFQLNDTITPLLTTMTASTLTSGASSASWATIIAGSGAPTLFDVLNTNNSASGLSITNVNDIQLSTINSSAYPPPTPNLDTVLLAGSNAGASNIDMNGNDINGVDNINVITINNLTPTTLGLTWADFTGTNANNNLPSLSYQVFNGSSTTNQYADKFDVNLSGFTTTINTTGMTLFDSGSATTTSYLSNNIQSTNGTAFTITAGFGASQPLNLECSQLNINSVAYQPPRPVFWGGSSNAFMISSGSFQNVGTLIALSLTANTNYILRYSLTIYNTIYDGTFNMYPQFYNASGNWDSQTWNSTRPSNAISNNSAFSGATSQFIVNDWVSFTADSNGQLLLDLYLCLLLVS